MAETTLKLTGTQQVIGVIILVVIGIYFSIHGGGDIEVVDDSVFADSLKADLALRHRVGIEKISIDLIEKRLKRGTSGNQAPIIVRVSYNVEGEGPQVEYFETRKMGFGENLDISVKPATARSFEY